MEKKYQVFISSTYSDLIEERRKVLDILLVADCIPAGMEAFVATDAEQFDVIKKVIDLCDYYILIIGKRYGSIHPETGLSYTEMEYEYAIEKGIPVLVFSLDSSVILPQEKTESDPIKIKKLRAFREKAMTNRLASIWTSSEDLVSKLAVSIMKATKEISRPGWQRGTDYDEASLRRDIMELQEKNEKLTADNEAKAKEIAELTQQTNLAFYDYEITMDYVYYTPNGHYGQSQRHSDEIKTNLQTLFIFIATEMMNVFISESAVRNAITSHYSFLGTSHYLSDNQFVKRVLNQFQALGLVSSKWSEQRTALYWGLTPKGEKVRNDLILMRNT